MSWKRPLEIPVRGVCRLGAVLLAGLPGLQASEAPPDTGRRLGAEDWVQLRQARDQERLRFRAAATGGFSSEIPAQGWSVSCDGRGFTRRSAQRDGIWGLALLSYGSAGAERPLPDQPQCSAGARRVEYAWSPELTEWFQSTACGLQQGWTLHAPPAATVAGPGDPPPAATEISLTLQVAGGLVPSVRPDVRTVDFIDSSGLAVVSYGGLMAWDAVLRPLPVRFEDVAGSPSTLRVVVAVDALVEYPVTIDPIAQEAYLKASNPDPGDGFGAAVAVAGDVVAVSSVNEASAAEGINGDQSDNSASQTGAVYVFSRTNGVWVQEAYLKAGNAGLADWFGFSLALSGNTLVVGAPFEDSYPKAQPDPVNNDNLKDSGAAYVFVRDAAGVWTQQAMLKGGGDARYSLEFGHSVDIDGDTIVVGSRHDRNTGTGIDSPYSDTPGNLVGAAYVYTRQGTQWSLAGFIKPPFTTSDGSFEFGRAVAVGGHNIFVGVPRDASASTGINGDMTQNLAVNGTSGAVFAYRLGPNGVQFDSYIKASNAESSDAFGYALAAAGESLVVSAIGEDSDAVGINGGQGNSTTKQDSGAVYAFDRTAGGWSQTAYIKAPVTASSDRFGLALAFDGDTLAVGSSSKVAGSEGSLSYPGTAYLYARQGGTWQYLSFVKPGKRNINESFAAGLAVDDGRLVVSASGDDNGGTGVNNPATNTRSNSGAAYLYSGFGAAPASPILIQEIQLAQQQLVFDFTADPGHAQWKVFGGTSVTSLADDLASLATITEQSPGRYHASVALPPPLPASYFVRISP